MMTSPLELNLDYKTHIYSMLVKSFGEHSPDQQTHKLEEFVARLEEERLKIDAFKRELPLCMQLLNNAMEASRQQLQSQRTNQCSRPVLEEFIPLKNTSSALEAPTENEVNASADKSNWMTSAQLWNQDHQNEENKPPSPLSQSPQETDIKLALSGKQRINGGAFTPFPSNKDRNSNSSISCTGTFPELALASPCEEEMEEKKISVRENSSKSGNNNNNNNNNNGEKEQNSNNQTQRKARRCWSPDLHRRFVNALHMLGGSQVATPKQIRELMKVDGLTNDEVKSHLQKYRLHTRRPSPSPHTAVTGAPQLVVLGGIWVPPEYAAAAAHGGAQAAALYGAHTPGNHHMPSQFCSGPPPMQQDMYPQNYQMRHHQLQVYNNPTLTQRNSSPESDTQGGGGASESIEDDKSESGSWKADSGGENGGEVRRIDGEDHSNASVVTLKF